MAIAPKQRSLDHQTQSKLATFMLARLSMMTLVLFTTVLLRQEVLGESHILKIYTALGGSFLLSLVSVTLWDQTLRVRLYIPSQLIYDILLTSYLVFLTGVGESIFLFLYLINIVFASVVYQLNGALIVAAISGSIYATILYVNADTALAFDNIAYNELLFLLTALLCGQLMDELKKQKILLETQRENIARLELLNDRLLNSIPLGIVTVDSNEYVHNINRTALSLLQLEHTPDMRIKYYELFPELKGIIAAWKQMSDVQRLRFTFMHGNAPDFQFSLNLVELKRPEAEGEALHHVFVFQDVSKVLELEKRLEFESRLSATGELAAGIAHEIRNPLASISGAIEMLAKNLVIQNPADQKLIDIATREIKRLNLLITDFLEFAKPRDDVADDFPLRKVITEVSEAVLNSGLPGRKVIFTLNVDESTHIHINRERMKQVLFNLFLNSMEASIKEMLHITVSSRPTDDGHISIDVIDDGPGIPSDHAQKIFTPFYTTKPKGTGLGLATVARILKAAKSEISLHSHVGGAHFHILVPASSRISLAGTGT